MHTTEAQVQGDRTRPTLSDLNIATVLETLSERAHEDELQRQMDQI